MLIKEIHKNFGVSISVLCRRFSLPRATFYRQSKKDDSELRQIIQKIAEDKPAWGYRMIWAELRKQGIKVNHKRVYRVYSALELQKPVKRSNKKHSKTTEPFEGIEPEYAGHVWAVDFLHDRTSDRRAFRIFNVIDVFSRRSFEPAVERSLLSKTIAEYFDSLCQKYGPPRIIRRDNGPEFRSFEFQAVLKKWRIRE
ncbi:MAG: transposase, partial [Nitrospirae bacterium]